MVPQLKGERGKRRRRPSLRDAKEKKGKPCWAKKSRACGAVWSRYNLGGAISLAQPSLSGLWGQEEVAPMEQFLSNVFAGVLANIIVLVIDRKFFR